nr:hypothetical protein [Tanacetum cinerariifolium]
MSSIIAQQTKLDPKLVPKEKRLDIGKYVLEVNMHQFWDSIYKHGTFYKFKIDERKIFKLTLEVFRDIFKICPRVQGQDFNTLPTDEEIMSFLRGLGHSGEIHSLNDVFVDQMHQHWRTFAALTEVYLERQLVLTSFVSPEQIIWGMYHQKNVDYVELLWEDFIYQIDNKAYKKQDMMYYPRFTKVIIHHFLTQDKTLSWRNKIGIHTSKDDYLINTLRIVFAREETQIYDAILLESLTSPEMKETKVYNTYLGFDIGATPLKARKFKKPASPKLITLPVSIKEPIRKSKRVKRPKKKSTQAPARGVVIRETPEILVSKKKEKVDVAGGKGIELLPDVALTEEARYEETHPSGSGTATKPTPSTAIIKHSVTNEGTGVKPGVPDVADKAKGDEDEEIDYTTSQLFDDVDIRLNEPVDSDKRFVQEEDIPHSVAEIVSPLDVHVHREVKNQLPQILPEEVANFAPLVAATLIEFELKKILIDKMEKSESYLAAPEHRECYEGLKKYYDLDKTFFSTYGKVYSLKRSRKEKDKDEDPSVGSDQGLKKRKTSKDIEPPKVPKAKTSQSSSSKGDKSKLKYSRKFVQSEEPEFEVTDSALPEDRFKYLARRIGMRCLTPAELEKRVEDIQLGVESYQKKINVTRPETTKFDITKRDPYTPYQDPQGFIYVDDSRRNKLMRSDELYKFGDDTLTNL